MHDVLLFLSSTLPYIAALFVLLVIGAHLYLKLRKSVPVKVNCWFCNTWLRVPYENKNSFNCTNCMQYNGFNADGDYNKDIPEQHKVISKPNSSYKQENSNGLCKICNNNQQLKIYQLANFVPFDKNNYDAEIEHFQKQLEKAYKLCKACDNVLKSTLETQNRWLFGMKFLKFTNERKITKSSIEIKRKDYSIFIRILLLAFAVIILVQALNGIDYSNQNLEKNVPKFLLPHIYFVKKKLAKTGNVMHKFYNDNVNTSNFNITKVYKVAAANAEDILEGWYTKFATVVVQYLLELRAHLPVSISYESIKYILVIMLSLGLHLKLQIQNEKDVFIPIMSWTIIVVANIVDFNNVYVKASQIVGVALIIYSLKTSTRRKSRKTKEKTEDTKNNSSNSFSTNNISNSPENSFNSSHSAFSAYSPTLYSKPQNTHTFGSSMLNRSKSPSSFSEISSVSKHRNDFPTKQFNSRIESHSAISSCYKKPLFNADLHNSFLKLNIGNSKQHCHISNMMNKPSQITINPDLKRPRPVLSPAKLHVFDVLETNLSRSSSQSSGFMSIGTNPENNFQPLPLSRPNSLHGDADNLSLFSEPVSHYHEKDKQLPNHFYPIHKPKELLNAYPLSEVQSEYSNFGSLNGWSSCITNGI